MVILLDYNTVMGVFKGHLPVFSSSVLGVLGLFIISTSWFRNRGIYFDVSGPESTRQYRSIIFCTKSHTFIYDGK